MKKIPEIKVSEIQKDDQNSWTKILVRLQFDNSSTLEVEFKIV
jgi:hypothetical protein